MRREYSYIPVRWRLVSVSFIIVNLHPVIDMDRGDSTGMHRPRKETWDAIEEARRLASDPDVRGMTFDEYVRDMNQRASSLRS